VGREETYQGLIDKQSMCLNTNRNGQRLVDFAAAKNILVSSTRFPHKEIRKQTWRSPDGKTNNQTDHTLTFQRGVMSAACHSENITCRGVTSTARHAVRFHSFDNISTTYGANVIRLLCACC
jgi:hypothetical protein